MFDTISIEHLFSYVNFMLEKSHTILQQLHSLALKYEKLTNRFFLFCSCSKKSQNYYWYEINFQPKNFMHLAGFKSKIKTGTEFFESCLQNPPALDYKNDCIPAYNHTREEICGKLIALNQLLDLKTCKYFSVGDKDKITMHADFKFAYGNNGIIGFGNISSQYEANPAITCIPRSIQDFCTNSHKISFILEKYDFEKIYERVYSEVKPGLVKKLLEQDDFPDELKIKIVSPNT